MRARSATSEDLDAIAGLGQVARSEADGERGAHLLLDLTHASLGVAERYERALEADQELLTVGLVDDAVVGYGMARIEQGATETVCVLDELFVHPQARSVGIGAAILSSTQAWARERRCSYVESQVLPGNRESKNFFERVGMVTRAMRVSARLD